MVANTQPWEQKTQKYHVNNSSVLPKLWVPGLPKYPPMQISDWVNRDPSTYEQLVVGAAVVFLHSCEQQRFIAP
jgi:hypothetical protein